MILKQERERKLVKGFLSGTTPEGIEKILIIISFQESSNSSIWDELNFENSRYTTVSISHLGWITEKNSQRENVTYKGRKISNINKRNGR